MLEESVCRETLRENGSSHFLVTLFRTHTKHFQVKRLLIRKRHKSETKRNTQFGNNSNNNEGDERQRKVIYGESGCIVSDKGGSEHTGRRGEAIGSGINRGNK